MLTLYFDGLCEPRNPGGIACYGWVLIDQDGNKIDADYGEVCRGPGATNNVAEYAALEAGLVKVLDRHWSPEMAKRAGALKICGDSQLVIHQVTGRWACNKEHLRVRRDRCIEMLKQLGSAPSIEWIPRERNTAADDLSRRAYVRAQCKNEKGVGA